MSKGKTILLVEDDPAIAMIIRETLVGECGHFASVASLAERNAWLADHRVDLVITDVVLPDGDGIDSLAHAGIDPATPVIVLSAQNTLDTAVRATGIGSYDYLPKPFDLDELTASVRAALERSSEPAARDAAAPADSHGLVGRAPAMQAVYRTIARLASNDLAVLILGESGTGKEVVARAIHATGLRRNGPFVAINMAAIPRELIEAELFGHEKGAFTGAHSRNAGRFEQAAGGSLFLDEQDRLAPCHARRPSCATGRCTRKRVHSPSRICWTVPPMSRASLATSARPSPRPSRFVVTKGSNRSPRMSAGTPGPLSLTLTSIGSAMRPRPSPLSIDRPWR